MNPEQENFQDLRRLLALKRHEQPPPGYFDRFSREVTARIRAGERAPADSLWEQLSESVPWLQGLRSAFETKPALAGAFGLAICGVLVAGLAFSERAPEGSEISRLTLPSAETVALGTTTERPSSSPFQGQAAMPSMAGMSLQNAGSLFGEFRASQQPQFQPASFNAGGN